ncbi:hypothetical protein C8Q80DRAFT_1171010 [Daedaleopsis nitida]|nr:hypothetical protein C8Q80DRAFT_1171010 [Daedaleopsis nitida]
MDGADMDTDTMLALLSSLIHPLEVAQSTLLDALAASEGDIEAAAKSLRSEPPRKKRRTSSKAAGIEAWLNGSAKHDQSSPSRARPYNASTQSHNNISHDASGSSSSVTLPKDRAADSPQKPPMKTVTQTELMALLRPPKSSDNAPAKPQVPRHPPLTLVTPEHVAEHTPCTLHNSILPPDLACRLFYTMLHASRDWKRNKWWLFDRVVESPHRTSFFVRRDDTQGGDMKEAAQYWYNGRPTDPPPTFPPPMEEACEIIERVVNEEMRKRRRFPLEWDGYPVKDGEQPVLWRANVAASNCYEGAKESVGFHSDQVTYLGPYPTIASLSLGVSRTFRLKEVIPTDEKDKRSTRTYSIPLRHNSLIIMHAETQEVFKHCVPAQNTIDMFHPPLPPPPDLADVDELAKLSQPSNARINITFRFYRPDFRSQTTPRCRCDVPCILRPDMKNRYEDMPPADKHDMNNTENHEASNAGGVRKRDMVAKYWWTCYAGAQNDGQGCNFWKVMDVKAEGRGPFVGDVETMQGCQ